MTGATRTILQSLRHHVRGLWRGWSALLPLPFPAWAIYRVWTGTARWEHLSLLVVAPALAFGTPSTKRLFVGLYPFCLVAIVYDSMYLVRNVGLTPERVHVCDLRALDMRIFGLRTASNTSSDVMSVHDWLQAHANLALDVLCAIPYGTFIFVSIAFAVFLYRRDERAMRRFGWTFLIVNWLGFATYHIYPAAPPWYFHSHGCVIDLSAHASEGPNLARVDAWLGFPYFASFYGRSNDVFGAVPSLHVTYPLLVAMCGYRYFGSVLRMGTIAYFLLMCFAAVYLDHHWILDVLLGITYTLATEAAQSRIRHGSFSARQAEPRTS
jgi:inositol phosphorylceramide synthase catalytic subunit